MSDREDGQEADPLLSTRKRKFGDSEQEASQHMIKTRRQSESEGSSALPSDPNTVSEVTLASLTQNESSNAHPQYAMSLASMKTIKGHLAELTAKNKAIKVTMQEMREGVVGELLCHMRVRQIAIGQMGRPDLEDDMRELCLNVLEKRKGTMWEKEKELVNLERLLGGHNAMLELANAACVELDETICSRMEVLERGGEWNPLRTPLPHMTRLAKFTTAREGSTSSEKARSLFRTEPQVEESASSEPGQFTLFNRLPFEIRIQIWKAALPTPRILAPHAHNNRLFSLLQASQESRSIAEAHYVRILSPTCNFPKDSTPVIYANPDKDLIIRDLTIKDRGSSSLFFLSHAEFTTSCHQMLSGLSQIKQLALAYDILRENGGTLFRPIQVCCPMLQTLTIFPSAQLSTQFVPSSHQKFIALDSNLIDYITFCWHDLNDRKNKRKALRGLAVLATLSSHALQYKSVFTEYTAVYGSNWNPRISLCLLSRWNKLANGWMIKSLSKLGDRSSKGFLGDDGRHHRSFVESIVIADRRSKRLSRYDGMERLFSEA